MKINANKNEINILIEESEEINIEDFPFQKAKVKDNRPLSQMFWFTFVSKIELLNIIVFPSVYDIVYPNIFIYSFSLGLDFTMNALLFSDDVISKRYESGSVSLGTTILLSLFSNIISFILSFGIIKLSVFSFAFEQMKKEIKNEKEFVSVGAKLFSIIKKRIIIIFVLQLVLMLFFIYYLIIFCTIYHSSQYNWMIDCITGMAISFAISVGISLLVALLRYIGLRRNSKFIFNISKYLNNK